MTNKEESVKVTFNSKKPKTLVIETPFGEARLEFRRMYANESLKYSADVEKAKLPDETYDTGKLLAAMMQILSLCVEVENLKDEYGQDLTLEAVKQGAIPSEYLNLIALNYRLLIAKEESEDSPEAAAKNEQSDSQGV